MEGSHIKGLCKAMCPRSEIELRERENLLHPFEVADGHTSRRPKADYEKCVKEYRRPTVGKQEVRPSDLRPPDVLVATVNYLIDNIATRGVPWNEIYDFMFDRLRSVRQDLVIQGCHGSETVEILEKVVRFHVYSDNRLCTEHISVFDQKINDQHTQECLKRLINLYKDWGSSRKGSNHNGTNPSGSGNNQNGYCENQPEFEATYILFNLGEPEALKHFYSLENRLRNDPLVRTAYEMSCAYILNNWVRVFRLVKRLKLPIHMCAVCRHFPQIQRKALFSLNIGFSSKNLKFPLEKLTELLFLNTDTETQHMCQNCGLSVIGTFVHFLKTSFKDQEKVERTKSDFISQQLRQWTLPNIIHGNVHKLSPDLQPTDFKELSEDFLDKCTL